MIHISNYFIISKGLNEKNKILDEEVVCLDLLGRMSYVDLEVLSQIMNSSMINSSSILIDGISPYIITGVVENLKSHGLLIQDRMAVISGVLESKVTLFPIGKNC